MNHTDTKKQSPGTASSSAAWVDFRRKRVWLILLILLYTLSGFFLVPVLLNKIVVDTVREDLRREASFEKIHFNPFLMALRAEGFVLKDSDGEVLAGFDQFFIDFQISSLFNWAWTFREISMDGVEVLFERYQLDDSRLSRLIKDWRSARPPDEATPAEGGLPRLLIQQLHFRQGGLQFRDHVPEEDVELVIGPADISVQELNTLPDRSGKQTVVIKFPGDSSLEWQGSIDLAPLRSEGSLTFRDFQLNQTISYLKSMIPLESVTATVAANTNYRLDSLPDGGLGLNLDNLQLKLSGITLSGLSPTTELLSLSELTLSGGELSYPAKELSFRKVTIERPSINTWLDENRQFNLLELRPDKSSSTADSPWKFEIDQLFLANGSAKFIDRGTPSPRDVSLSGLRLEAGRISNQQGEIIPVKISGKLDQGGTFEADGNTTVTPEFTFNGTSVIRAIPLELAQPYAQQLSTILIEDGLLSSELELTIEPESKLKLAGSIGVADLTIWDTRSDEKLLGWRKLNVDRFEWAVHERDLQLSLVSFVQPYGRFRINKDRTTNLSGLMIASQQSSDSPVTDKSSAPALLVGRISVNDGVLDFSDLSLPLQFVTSISDLDGSISTIATASNEPATIRLEGQVDEYGLARIEGTMSVFDPIGHTDVSVEFRNLLMSDLSPYTAQFAGREIDEGKLDLDLGYAIEKGQLQAQNKVVLSDLVLGAEVDNPDAVSLPLDLAVSLLKDSDGVINIDLPVSGDVNNPEFKISGVVVQAIVGLITKVVSAPFRLLGSLIGIDSENLGRFQFLAGRSDLLPPELEKIAQLQQALQQRPELAVEISGPFDPAVDIPKLQYFVLRDAVYRRLGQETTEKEEEFEMLDDEVRSILESLFTERFSQIPLASLKSEHTTESSGLDELSYAGDLRDRLLESEIISPADLETLANARAEAVRQAFLASGEFSGDRVRLSEPVKVESDDGEWVATELGVASG